MIPVITSKERAPHLLLVKAKRNVGAPVTLFVLACCLLFGIIAAWFGSVNWDMLGYVGSAKSASISSSSELHDYVYSQARQQLSSHDYDELIKSNSYRKTMHSDAELFSLQLPYYQIRVVWLKLMLTLEQLGIPMFKTGHIIAAACAAIAGMVVFLALRTYLSPGLWFCFPAVFIMSGALETARLFTPDTMSFLVFALAFLAFVRQHWSFFLIVSLAVFIRTDLIVMVALSVGFVWLFRPALRLAASLSLLASIGGYLYVNYTTGNLGWSAVHYYVFESGMLAADPRQFADHIVTPKEYINAILANLPRLAFFPPFWFFFFCSGLAILFKVNFQTNGESASGSKSESACGFMLKTSSQIVATWKNLVCLSYDPFVVTIVFSWMYFILHFLMFPLLDTRFFVGPYFLSAMCLLAYISNTMSNSLVCGTAKECLSSQ